MMPTVNVRERGDVQYRRLGKSGLKVSSLSFGSWVTFGTQIAENSAANMIHTAIEAGVNFFDNAEVYSGGESERIMGAAFAELALPRHSFIVSSKYFWGIHDTPHTKFTLNRKYLLEAVDKSLERLSLDHLDLIFCHRPDPDTPIEETVWAMSDIVGSGKAHYWGTSEWSAGELIEAYRIAEKHHLRAPVMEQPQYNMFTREKVEKEFAPLYGNYGLGLTTWSPLASGLLSGKYISGVPKDSRAALAGYEWLKDGLTSKEANEKVKRLKVVADKVDSTLSQLAIAWCLNNPNVSTVILGASKVSQLKENLAASEVVDRLSPEIISEIEAIIG